MEKRDRVFLIAAVGLCLFLGVLEALYYYVRFN
jgi:hypothetical protein